MERQAMWLFAALFFGSLPVAAILLIVSVFSPSSGSAKGSGLFTILTLTGLLAMVGLNLLARFAALKNLGDDSRGPHVP